jgi:hypothetical protein
VRRVAIAEDGAGGTTYLRSYCPDPLTDAVCCLAGPLVESAVSGRPLAEVLAGIAGTEDLAMARKALARDASGTSLRTAVRIAAELISRYAANVEALAEALLASGGVLDGEALAILCSPISSRG